MMDVVLSLSFLFLCFIIYTADTTAVQPEKVMNKTLNRSQVVWMPHLAGFPC